MNSIRNSGVTLIELIIFIVVVSIGLVGILSVMNTTIKSSADPMVRKQALMLADSIMEEILQKEFQDPDNTPNVVEAGGRNTFDDVDDYNGLSNANFIGLPSALTPYVITITVVPGQTLNPGSATDSVTAKEITVTVSRAAETVTLVGYRTNI